MLVKNVIKVFFSYSSIPVMRGSKNVIKLYVIIAAKAVARISVLTIKRLSHPDELINTAFSDCGVCSTRLLSNCLSTLQLLKKKFQ